ncbi:hypothetical protein TGRUB_429880 [Toxoplasma gondii RUB]|uniref:Uncharacterized protein n=1 Tax=Toxoplasma gondii RUB TaxID=935652 RepID=A0A086M4C7_TOXGO|nr:hypothetical protein TGRUB_429880 [Toxoplasma gondii RUB]
MEKVTSTREDGLAVTCSRGNPPQPQNLFVPSEPSKGPVLAAWTSRFLRGRGKESASPAAAQQRRNPSKICFSCICWSSAREAHEFLGACRSPSYIALLVFSLFDSAVPSGTALGSRQAKQPTPFCLPLFRKAFVPGSLSASRGGGWQYFFRFSWSSCATSSTLLFVSSQYGSGWVRRSQSPFRSHETAASAFLLLLCGEVRGIDDCK